METISAESKANICKAKPSGRSKYRPEIDGIRAFAVVAVIVNHFNNNILPGGYLGVDIFFVISGYVITSSLSERSNSGFLDFISGFYERRIKRLVPALAIFVLLMSIAICIVNPTPATTLKTGLTSLFGISNLYLLKQSTDYFAQSTELNVFTHTWSLGVEEQFYILFPFLIWISRFGTQAKRGARNLFIIIFTLTITSLLLFLRLYPLNQTAAYFLMPSRFWEIAAGCLVFIGYKKQVSIERPLEKIPPLLILVSMIGVMYLPISLATASTIAVVILSSALIASLKRSTAAFQFFTHPTIVYIGLISYSLYLWHWGVLSISKWTIGIHWWSVPFQIAIMLGLAVASFHWVETPLRNNKWLRERWMNLLAGGGTLVVLSGGLITLIKPLEGKLFTGSEFNKWNMNVHREIEVRRSPTANTIYLLGDSHAGHYAAVMDYTAKQNNHNFVYPQQKELGLKNNAESQEYILASIDKYSKQFKQGDIIIFSAAAHKYLEPHHWTRHYETFLKQTKNLGLKYILISPTANFSSQPIWENCQQEWYRPSWAIAQRCFTRTSKQEWMSMKKQALIALEAFIRKNPNVAYIDAFTRLCPDDYCANHDQKILLYRDHHHLSSHGAMQIADLLNHQLD